MDGGLVGAGVGAVAGAAADAAWEAGIHFLGECFNFFAVVNDLVVKSFCCWGVSYVVKYIVVDVMSLSRQVLQGPSSSVMICKK